MKLSDEEIIKAIALLAHKEKIHVNDASKLSQAIRQLMEERDSAVQNMEEWHKRLSGAQVIFEENRRLREALQNMETIYNSCNDAEDGMLAAAKQALEKDDATEN